MGYFKKEKNSFRFCFSNLFSLILFLHAILDTQYEYNFSKKEGFLIDLLYNLTTIGLAYPGKEE